jgi:carboxylate-amine ligase
MPQLIDQLINHVGDALQELGDTDRVEETLQRLTGQGNGAVRQRKAFREGDDIIALTEVTL